MGDQQVCRICKREGNTVELCVGYVKLVFEGGEVYEVPMALGHYVRVHSLRPLKIFIEDVMKRELVAPGPHRTRKQPIRIEYPDESVPRGFFPPEFPQKLDEVIARGVELESLTEKRELAATT